MKQILLIGGRPAAEEVPDPVVEKGSVLVRSAFSCISSGTELAAMRSVAEPLWRRALRQPERVRQVLTRAARDGVLATIQDIHGRLGAPVALGYSASGVVVAVGEGVAEFHVGDRVAVAGSQCAYHAEILNVPRNLAVGIPEHVGLDAASTVALGAIALQGVRRADPTLGETIVVLGLGVLGQLTCQILKANGCRVIAGDIDQARVDLARKLGADAGVPIAPEADEAALRLTGGMGADAVIVAAATTSNDVVSQAFRMCRRKGRVVLVGDVGLDLDRADMYAKELDLRMSCSYGPGRYDSRFEDEGVDYPYAYVRWTETRNMAEYLRLLEIGAVKVESLIRARFPAEQVAEAYAALEEKGSGPTLSLFEYAAFTQSPVHSVVTSTGSNTIHHDGRIRLAVIGAGNFFKGAHLPVLRGMADQLMIRAVVSRTGHNAKAMANQCNAEYAATDLEKVLQDPDVDALLIATRHHLHGEMALRALAAGKHVLVEKPLALTHEDLDAIEHFYASGDQAMPLLMTGFNRRFSPYAEKLAELLAARNGPMLITYRMNAGHIAADHWVHGLEGGGRNLGEACHIYNLFLALTGAAPTRIEALAIAPANAYFRGDDNFVATIRFSDGSVGTLAYTALGAAGHSKEQMEIFCDGDVYRLDDYVSLTRTGSGRPLLESKSPDKGLREQWQAFSTGIRTGVWPVSLGEQLATSRLALDIQSRLAS